MKGHECYHCKQWVAEGEPHDCWTTTEAALTRELSEDLQDAYQRLREAAADLGEQRIYASHKCIMFSRKACYFFVRPHRKHLELCVFLGRPIRAPQIRRVEQPSKTKVANILRVTHRDEVEEPITGWLREAYEFAAPAPPKVVAASSAPGLKTRPTSAKARPTSAKTRPTSGKARPTSAKARPASKKASPTDVGRTFRSGTRKLKTRAKTPRRRR